MPAFLLRAPAPLLVMALIFYLSAQSDPGPDLPAIARIPAHSLEYAFLTLAWAWALSPIVARPALPAALISFVYAITDEYHQSFVAGRESDPLDVLVDTAGIALAAWLVTRRQNLAKRA